MKFHRNRRLIQAFALLALFMAGITMAVAHDYDAATLEKKLLAIDNGKQRVDSAMAWMRYYANDEREEYLLKTVLNYGKQTSDVTMQTFALKNLSRLYYNCFEPDDEKHTLNYYDSIDRICEEIEKLDLQTDEQKRYYCDVMAISSLSYTNRHKFIKVRDIATDILNNHSLGVYGTITSYDIFGQIYEYLKQYELAADYYAKAFKLSLTEGDYITGYSIYLCLMVCETLVNDQSESKLIEFLPKLKKLIDADDHSNAASMSERNYCLLYTYYLAYYLEQGDMEQADKYARLANIPTEYSDIGTEQIISTMLSRYYMKKGDLQKAAEYISLAPEAEYRYVFYLRQKVAVLKALGQYEEATEVLKNAYEEQFNTFNHMYLTQIEELANRNQTEKLKRQRAAREATILILIICFTITIILLLSYYNRRLMKAKKRAEEASMSQKLFLQNMSHEIRTPLNAICGFSQLLTTPEMREFITDEEMASYGNIIRSNTDMLTTLVNDILDISDMNSGKYRMNFSDCSANAICNGAIHTVSYRCPEHIKLYFTSEVDDNFLIHSDSQRATQIIINYLTNAIKHTNEGEIHVHCSLSENPGKLTFSVTDTGEGVPVDKAEVIFGRFEKLDTFRQGTGLGLAICHSLAIMMNGMVKLDTTYTNGARFLFIHPLIEEEKKESVDEQSEENKKEKE